MLPYIALMAVPVLFQHINTKKGTLDVLTNDKKNTERAMTLFWVLLFLMLVLRHDSIGRDLPNYEFIFDYIARNNWSKALGRSEEIGWSFVNKVVSIFGGDFRALLIVVAILSVIFIAIGYIKYSHDAALSVALYMNLSTFIFIFSGLRQSVAISLGFLAFELVRKKKFISFLILVAIAMTFHISAFMLLFMYPLYHVKIKREHLIFIVPLYFVALLLNQQIFSFLSDVLSSFADYDTTIEETGAYAMLVLFALIAIVSFIVPDETKIDSDTIGIRNFLLLSVGLQMFASLHVLAMRMNYYYIAFIPILVTRVISTADKKWYKLLVAARYVLIVILVSRFILSVPEENALDTFPYKFYWEDDFILK